MTGLRTTLTAIERSLTRPLTMYPPKTEPHRPRPGAPTYWLKTLRQAMSDYGLAYSTARRYRALLDTPEKLLEKLQSARGGRVDTRQLERFIKEQNAIAPNDAPPGITTNVKLKPKLTRAEAIAALRKWGARGLAMEKFSDQQLLDEARKRGTIPELSDWSYAALLEEVHFRLSDDDEDGSYAAFCKSNRD